MDIELLIPHRGSIVMIDEIISHSLEETTTSFLINHNNIFVDQGVFQSPGIIENMAQSAAARFGIENFNHSVPPSLGYIASIKNLNINNFPVVGQEIVTRIVNKNQINQLIIIGAEVSIDKLSVASCELKVFIDKK